MCALRCELTGGFRATNLRPWMSLIFREENFESPPESSHPASQVTAAHVDGYVANGAGHHTISRSRYTQSR